MGIVDVLAYLKLQYAGFHFHRLPLSRFFTLFPFRPITLTTLYRSPAKHMTYWYRPHTSTTRLPVLFIHGIGIGLYPYTRFLADINANANGDDGQIRILAIEIMPISFRISHPALGKDDMCAELHGILTAHNYTNFVLISHSYGSVISTHILSNPTLRSMVSSTLFIDPVSFLLHTPDVAYNFTIRKPRRANEWQLWFFASKDPGVAHALGRRFFWSENVMWREDVEELVGEGKGVAVSLGGRDLIVNTAAVRRYLADHSTANGAVKGTVNGAVKGCARICESGKQDPWQGGGCIGKGLEVLWFDNLDHSQVFDKRATRAQLVKVVREFCGMVPTVSSPHSVVD